MSDLATLWVCFIALANLLEITNGFVLNSISPPALLTSLAKNRSIMATGGPNTSSNTTGPSDLQGACTSRSCIIGANNLRLVYWAPDDAKTANPTDPATSGPSTLVSGNYTFTSPSVYVIYTSLAAYLQGDVAKCTNSDGGIARVGTVHDLVTVAYNPDDLSTGHCYHTDWTPINYTQLYYPRPDYEVVTQSNCFGTQGMNLATVDSSYLLEGYPLLSIPSGLSSVDPLWSTCAGGADYGGYDPPVALTKAHAMVSYISTPLTPLPSTPAQPAASPADPLPLETPTTPHQLGPTTLDMQPEFIPNNQKATATIPKVPILPQGNVATVTASGEDPGGQGFGLTYNAAVQSKVSVSPGNPNNGQNGAALLVSSIRMSDHPDEPAPGPASAALYAGEIISGITNLSPDSVPVTTDNMVYLSGPSATALVRDGEAVPIDSNIAPSTASSADLGGSSPNTNQGTDPFGDMSIRQNSDGGLLFHGSLTLPPGAQMTHSGDVISVGSGVVVADGSYYAWATRSGQDDYLQFLAPVSPTPSTKNVNLGSLVMLGFEGTAVQRTPNTGSEISGASLVMVGGIAYTVSASSSALAIDAQSLQPGGSTFTSAWTSMSPAPAGTVVSQVSDTHTQPLVISIAGSAFTANSASDFVIGDHTVAPGPTINISGTPISMDPEASIVVVGNTTQTMGYSSSGGVGALPMTLLTLTSVSIATVGIFWYA